VRSSNRSSQGNFVPLQGGGDESLLILIGQAG
jgi:hypothetical protein